MYYRYVLAVVAASAVVTAMSCSRPKTEENIVDLQTTGVGSIVRVDPAFDALVPPTAKIEKLLGGHEFTEGPMYMREGYLLFSDIPRNTIYKWQPDARFSEFRKPSGYDGNDAPKGALIGSNGITGENLERLTICEHGNRRVIRIEKNDAITVLAD